MAALESTNRPVSDRTTGLPELPRSVAHLFWQQVERRGPHEAYLYPRGDAWVSRTWDELGDEVRALAAGLIELGIEPEERVAIASATRYEWIVADLAIMCSAGATTTIYPSTIPSDVAFILQDAECRAVFAENDAQVEKLLQYRDELPALRFVVTMDGTPDPKPDDDPDIAPGREDGRPWVIAYDELMSRGRGALQRNPSLLDERTERIQPADLATLIYTSGTTGRSKGVRLSHRAWTYLGMAVSATELMKVEHLEYRWLPMAHSFGKVLLAAQLGTGFATAIDGRVDKIIENLAVVQPTFMGAAPRIFEKAYAKIVGGTTDDGGPKAAIFKWACEVGAKKSRLADEGKPFPAALRVADKLADKLVFSKVRDRFGNKIEFFISGSAPLNTDISRFFIAVGLPVLEGYGLTETAGAVSVNMRSLNKVGTVGPMLDGTECRIADDGEVLLRGPGIMDGYHNLPDATAETLDADGWLHTGDIGELDADGYLRLTDRKKDLFKTSGGKYVAPSFIEGSFKAVCPLASQMVVHGYQRNFCSAIITLDADAVATWAGNNGMKGRSYAEVVATPEMRDVVQGYLDQLNLQLNRWEQIKKFVLLDHDLSIESGELTPSMKVKRAVVEQHYREQLDELYGG